MPTVNKRTAGTGTTSATRNSATIPDFNSAYQSKQPSSTTTTSTSLATEDISYLENPATSIKAKGSLFQTNSGAALAEQVSGKEVALKVSREDLGYGESMDSATASAEIAKHQGRFNAGKVRLVKAQADGVHLQAIQQETKNQGTVIGIATQQAKNVKALNEFNYQVASIAPHAQARHIQLNNLNRRVAIAKSLDESSAQQAKILANINAPAVDFSDLDV